MYTGTIGIPAPEHPDGLPMTVTIKTLPRGLVRDGAQPIRAGDRLQPEALPRLVFVPEPGYVGSAGLLAYEVTDGRGGSAESAVEIDVMDAAEAANEMAEASLWERLRSTGRPEDLDLFNRLYPNSRFSASVAQRRAELARAAQAGTPAAPPPRVASIAPVPAPPAPVPPAPIPPPAAEPTPAPRDRVVVLQPPRAPAAPVPPSDGSRSATARIARRWSWSRQAASSMGSGARDPAAAPAHRVTLRPFALSQEPITIGDWKACQAAGGCGPLPRMAVSDDAVPLHNVSWDDAQKYIAWLSSVSGHAYRLPSEAEWEYAARAGTTTRYAWGEQLGVALADCADCAGQRDTKAPTPARNYPPNALGLYGMSGGVAQWVQDCWFPNYAGAPSDGSAREARACQNRVLRGGSFKSSHDDITPFARNHYDAPVRYYTNGFRVARSEGR